MTLFERVDQSIRRSPVWRSIFRNPYPDDERSRAYAVMNNVFLHLHPVRVRQHAVRFAYTFCLGGLSFFLFLVLTVTGVYLMFFYIPSDTQAYSNILDIQSRVTFGLLTRNIHRWAAHLMVFFVFLHMMRVFYHGAYKPPREFNWVVGVVLLFLTIGLSFTGYLLPWDQISYWAITIGSNMAGYFPLVNSAVQAAAPGRHRGGPEHAAPVLRAARDRVAADRGRLPRGPLLADPQGRWHQRPALSRGQAATVSPVGPAFRQGRSAPDDPTQQRPDRAGRRVQVREGVRQVGREDVVVGEARGEDEVLEHEQVALGMVLRVPRRDPCEPVAVERAVCGHEPRVRDRRADGGGIAVHQAPPRGQDRRLRTVQPAARVDLPGLQVEVRARSPAGAMKRALAAVLYGDLSLPKRTSR